MTRRRSAPKPPKWARPLWGLLPAVALAGLVICAPAVSGVVRGGGFAGGYDRLVDAIAQRQWLAVAYDENGEMSVGLRQDAVGQDPRLRQFVNNSYLRDDFADPAVWTLSDDGLWVTGIDPYAHRIDRPLSDPGAWRGDLRFRGGTRDTVSLADADRPEREPLQFQADGAPAGACDIVMPSREIPAAAPRRALGICVRDGRRPPRAAATVLLVGDRLLLRVQNAPSMEIKVGQRDVNPRTDGKVAFTPIEPGEVLSLRWNRAVLRLKAVNGARDISHRERNGARTYYPGLQGVAQAVEQGLSGHPERPLRLSLDAGFQAAAQAALETQAANIRAGAEPGGAPDPGEAFKGSVTVMDPISGQILAAATYPLDPQDLAADQRRTRRGRALIAQNHNFERLPIGSMAKGPFSLAILDADPRLTTLKLQGGPKGRVRTVLGMDLGKGGFDNHPLGLTDFPSFLEHSNNRFALALMMLAYGDPAAVQNPPRPQAPWSETWYLDGKARTDAPPLPIYGQATAPGPFGWVLQPPQGYGPAWPSRLSSLFSLDSGQDSACRYEVSVWRGVGGTQPGCDSAFAAASPERERLGFDAISSFHTDYLMAILGGGRSTWSSIKVAEVYSRIVTGRLVRARMTLGPVEDSPPLPLHNPEVRAVVLDGLERVPRTGTAGWLGAQFRTMGYDPDIRLFAKTGTMKVAGDSPPDPGNAILRNLAVNNCGLRWDRATGALKFGVIAPRSRAEAAAQVLALKETRCRVRVAGRPAVAEQVAAEMERHACGFRNCAPIGVTPLADGRVTAIPEREVDLPLVDGHAVAVVAARFADGRPVGGLTVVVNFQDKRTTEAPALAVAAAVLQSPAAKAWITGGPWP